MQLIITPRIQALVQECISAEDSEEWAKSAGTSLTELNTFLGADAICIPHGLVGKLHSRLGNDEDILASLQGSEVYVPPKVVPKRSPELEAILAKIRKDQAQKEYDAMVSVQETDSEATDWKEVQRTVTTMINIGLSLIGTSVAVYWAAGNIATEWKILMSMAGAVMIGGAETVLYLLVGGKRKIE